MISNSVITFVNSLIFENNLSYEYSYYNSSAKSTVAYY